jgi:hypothetical protein
MITSGQSAPFDVQDTRRVFYDLTDPESVDHAIVELRDHGEYALANAESLRNPLSAFEAFSTLPSRLEDGGDLSVANLLLTIDDRLQRIEKAQRDQARQARRPSAQV